jgi:hypothetical protein
VKSSPTDLVRHTPQAGDRAEPAQNAKRKTQN